MSLRSWLRNLRSALTPHGSQRKHGRQGSRRDATHRPHLEALEDRLTPSFSPAVSVPVDTNPLAVVTGDFNGDGHLDLATANPDANTINVLLGEGAGGFGTAISSAGFSGVNRVSLTVADFNNDGRDDLAIVARYVGDIVWGGAGVGVFLSNGDGTFGSATGASTADSTLAVAAGDFNNDGNSDLVVTGWDTYGGDGDDGFVQFLQGNGHGGFAETSPMWLSVYRVGLTVGELNGDGNLDVIATDGEFGGWSGLALLGNGAGRFVSRYEVVFGSTSATGGSAVGDFTGDGIADLVVAGVGVDTFVGRGDGAFAGPAVHSANG